MPKIYVLKCDNGKYYVGKTANIDRRLAEHFNGTGSAWTALHTPQEILEIKDISSEHDEMNTTLQYMKKFGIDNVRGAQWSNIALKPEQRKAIQLAMCIDACFECGQMGHYSSSCPQRNQSFRLSSPVECFKCGQHGHYANECTQNNRAMFCARCGRDSHYASDCYAFRNIYDEVLGCSRCGRTSHSFDKCFAKSDVEGRQLD